MSDSSGIDAPHGSPSNQWISGKFRSQMVSNSAETLCNVFTFYLYSDQSGCILALSYYSIPRIYVDLEIAVSQILIKVKGRYPGPEG